MLVALSTAVLGLSQTEVLRFDAASVKLAAVRSAGPTGAAGGLGTSDPGRITFTNLPLTGILPWAYGVQFYQIVGPESLNTQRYDIIASVPQGATRPQLNVMLQNLLAERFHLTVHHEIRSIPAYELTVGNAAPKLKPAVVVSQTGADSAGSNQPVPKPDPLFPAGNGPGIFMNIKTAGEDPGIYLRAKEQTLGAVASFLTRQLGAPVPDLTALTGKYDFTLAYLPPLGEPSTTSSALPSLADALKSELGLKLVSKKAMIDMLVVDHVDAVPTQN